MRPPGWEANVGSYCSLFDRLSSRPLGVRDSPGPSLAPEHRSSEGRSLHAA